MLNKLKCQSHYRVTFWNQKRWILINTFKIFEQLLSCDSTKYPNALTSLEVLDAIARKGSFAEAGIGLFGVPSAISYVVQELG